MMEEYDVENIQRRLMEFRNQSPPRRPIEVIWEFWTPETENLNRFLAGADEDRLKLTRDLLYLYRGEDRESIRRIFGNINPTGQRSVMGTLTPNEREFRIWHSRPSTYGINANHVDSAGSGLTLSVYGDPWQVNEYVQILMPNLLQAEFVHGARMGDFE